MIDPVHAAARAVVDIFDEIPDVSEPRCVRLRALRAALAAEPIPTPITDEMVERLAIHLLNEYRARADVAPVTSFEGASDFAIKDWCDRAHVLLNVAHGDKR